MSSSEWRRSILGELCNIRRGSSPRPIIDFLSQSGMPWVKIADATESGTRYINKTNECIKFEGVSKSVVVKPGTLILSNSGTAGLPMFMGIEACIHDGWQMFDNYNGIDKYFLYYQLLFIRERLLHGAYDSTMKNLTLDMVRNANILLPPLSEQKSIAATLSCLDDKIELNNRINKKLEEMAQVIYKNWFIDFEPFQDGDFEDDELGLIPKGWRVGTLGEVIELFDSMRKPLSSRVRDKMDKKYPYYGATSLMDYVEDYIFDGIYVLLGEDGTVADDAGYPILQYVWGKFWVNNHAHILKGKAGFNEDSIFMFLKNTNVQSVVTGAVQLKINQANLKSVKIIIPDKTVITEYNELIKPLFDKKRATEEENQLLIEIRDTILPKLMSGEIRVPIEEVQ